MLFASLSPPQLWNHSPVFQKPWLGREVPEIPCLCTLQDNWQLDLGDGLCSESYWQKQVLIPNLFTWVSKSDQIENCSKEEKPDWEEIQVVKWDQPQSNLNWRCPFVPLLCLSLSQVREEQDTQISLFMYAHSFTHIPYSFYTELCAPSPSTCVHATQWKYPYFHDSVSLCITISLSRLLPLFIPFHWLTQMVKVKEGGTGHLDTYLICVRCVCRVMSHFFTLQVCRPHLPFQISLHTLTDLWGG